ncbi:MAG TPA: ribosome-associated translation inhibitor RaiA [Planctomycetota bacterium]
MKVTVTGRHMDVTEVLRGYAIGKTERLTRYFDNIQRAEILFCPEKDGQFSAELILHAPRGSVLVVHAQDQTATAGFDTAFAKMERQLTKLKDRLRDKAKAARITRARRAAVGEAEAVLGEASGDIWW